MKKLYTSGLLAIIFLSLDAQTPSWAWAISAGGINSEEIYSITTDSEGNIYTCGFFTSPAITFGNITLNNPAYDSTSWLFHSFLIKQNSCGNVMWAKCLSNTGWCNLSCSSVCTDKNGFIYLAGGFSGTITFDTISLTTTGVDMFLVKYDNLGNVVWAKKSNSIQSPQAAASTVYLDIHGNIYVIGGFVNDLTIGNTTLSSQIPSNSFIAKYNSSGNAVWAKSIAGGLNHSTNDITVDTNENVYIIGNYRCPTLTIDTIVLTNAVTDTSTYDIFIARYDASGNIVWAKSFGGITGGLGELGESICTDLDGYIYATGTFAGSSITFGSATLSGNGSCANSYIIKFDKNFNIAWGKSFGYSGNNNGRKISTDAFGYTYVAGNFAGSLNVDNFHLSSVGGIDIYVAKFDSLGNTLSAISSGGTVSECIQGLCLCSRGICYIAGSFSSPSISFGNIILTKSSNSISNWMYDIYIAQIDYNTSSTISPTACKSYLSPSGKYIWTSSGTYRDTILNATGSDSVITVNLTIKNSTSSIISPTSCESYISPSGIYIWNSSGTYLDTIPNIAGCDSVITVNLTINEFNPSIILSGSTISTNTTGASYQWLDCNNGFTEIIGEIYQSFTPTANGSYGVEVTKYGCVDTSKCYYIANIGIHENSFGSSFSFFPNPTSGNLTINLGETYNEIDVNVRNIIGEVVLAKSYKTTNLLSFEITASKGVYFVEIRTEEGKMAIFKVIKE
ncbi:MAG: T9SS type A sorting domain-containing protein [Saprospiraceae bacterium]|nr:T9SS type A sorting domain-containing protein [Saprospiraceae bacterium]